MTTIKLYADEHIRKQIISALKNKGIDIISTDDAKNKGKADFNQLKFAASNKRAMLTRDSDYTHIKHFEHYGIFFIPKKKPDREIVSKIMEFLDVLNEDDVKGSVVYI